MQINHRDPGSFNCLERIDGQGVKAEQISVFSNEYIRCGHVDTRRHSMEKELGQVAEC